jgi:hypothetical protein
MLLSMSTAHALRPATVDPALDAIARAPISPFTEEEDLMLNDAEDSGYLSHEEFVANVCAERGLTPAQWGAATK